MHGCGAQLIPGPAVPWSPLGFDGQPALATQVIELQYTLMKACVHEPMAQVSLRHMLAARPRGS